MGFFYLWKIRWLSFVYKLLLLLIVHNEWVYKYPFFLLHVHWFYNIVINKSNCVIAVVVITIIYKCISETMGIYFNKEFSIITVTFVVFKQQTDLLRLTFVWWCDGNLITCFTIQGKTFPKVSLGNMKFCLITVSQPWIVDNIFDVIYFWSKWNIREIVYIKM